MQNQNQNANAQYQSLLIVWGALLMSQFIFLVMIFVIKPELFKFDFSKPLLGGENSVIVIALAVLGISTFFMSFVLKKKMLSQAIQEQKTALVQSSIIVACALCEATSLFGFVTVFVANYQYFFAWFALGILGIILHFPKRDDLFAASYKK
ncbi:MAG TPA: hypothetical protein PKY59_23920 [Pyrinomonadaceae bacterium]|nr:hypothetical protein [Pyrinomonadaceae bacterium]